MHIWDAALTNGISYEALNNIAHTTKRFIGILNDNEWSIAKNVGAISSPFWPAWFCFACGLSCRGDGWWW